MKKIIAVLVLVPALCFGAANDIRVTQTNSDNTGLAPTRLVAPPAGGANGIMGFNGSTLLPVHWTIGPGLSFAGGVLDTVAATPASWASISGKPSTIAGYGISDGVTFSDLSAGLSTRFPVPSGTTAQYIRGDGSLSTLPNSRRIEAYTGTTNAAGQIVVTYSSSFPATPVVQPPAPSAANQVWTTISSTATGFTLQLNQRNTVTLLSTEVLLGATVPVAGVSAIVLVVAQ